MKSFITPAYTFTPGASGVGTIDLSGITDFDAKKLVAVINQTRGVILYATGSEPLKYSAVAGSVITLNLDTSLMSSGDVLQVIYEQTIDFATEDTLSLIKGLLETAATIAKQEEIINKFGDVIAELALHGGKLPEVIGRNPVSGSLSVTLASGHEALVTSQTALVPSYQEDLTVGLTPEAFAAPVGAKYCKVMADSDNAANIRIKLGGTASASSGIKLEPGRSEDFQVAGDISYCADGVGTNKLYVIFGV